MNDDEKKLRALGLLRLPDATRPSEPQASRQVFMIGGGVYRQLEVHHCAYPTVFGGTTAIALVHRNPDVWMLQAVAGIGPGEASRNALVLVRFCPWCGIELKASPQEVAT